MIIFMIIIGILATALMTFFMYLMSYITKKPFKVVKVLGTMITLQTTPEKRLSNKTSVILIGVVVHYFVGIIFALTFLYLWRQGIIQPRFLPSLLFGLGVGLFGVVVWRVFFALHPNPPSVVLKDYLMNLVIAHLFFGVGIWISCKILSGLIVNDQWLMSNKV
jgi:hypothetical protein